MSRIPPIAPRNTKHRMIISSSTLGVEEPRIVSPFRSYDSPFAESSHIERVQAAARGNYSRPRLIIDLVRMPVNAGCALCAEMP